MPLARWQRTITDERGNVQPGAIVEVRREIPGAPLAVLYADRDGRVPLSNPVSADEHGFVAFHVAGGAYQIKATKGAFTMVLRYEAIGRASETDLEVVRPAGAWQPGTSYNLGDLVSHGGTLFISLTQGNVGNEPDSGSPPGDTEHWMVSPSPTAAGNVASLTVHNIEAVTREQYDALSPPDPNTLYIIVEP